MPYKNSLKFILSIYNTMRIFTIPNSARKTFAVIFCHSNNLKLLRIIFVQKLIGTPITPS